MPEWKDLLAILTTLFATFAGAWAAFALEGRRTKHEEQKKNVGAANRALYTVFNLWNFLEQCRKEVLEPFRAKPDDWLNLAANPTLATGECKFQVADLQFLLETPHAEVLAKLLLEEQRFAIAVDLIRARSALTLEKVFPAMAAAGIKVGQSAPLDLVEHALGIDVVHQLKQLTSAIYSNVDEDLNSLMATHQELRQTMKALYPEQKFLRIEFQFNDN